MRILLRNLKQRHRNSRCVLAQRFRDVDSLLGATLQATYTCSTCQLQTEEPVHRRCGSQTHLEHGYVWMTNDGVNALATLTGAIVALL